jgi:hypothetical protein
LQRAGERHQSTVDVRRTVIGANDEDEPVDTAVAAADDRRVDPLHPQKAMDFSGVRAPQNERLNGERARRRS